MNSEDARQIALAHAMSLVPLGLCAGDPQAILATAKAFEDYLLGVPPLQAVAETE
jgi:hypothetical protein